MFETLILGLTWFTLVQAVTLDMPEKLSTLSTVKVKRYFTHEHTPCPIHMPIPSIFPKQQLHGPPDHSKQIYKLPQILPQPSYIPWMMDQRKFHVKYQDSKPLYQHQSLVIHPIQSIQSNKHMNLPQWQTSQKINYHMAPHVYAPAYQTAMTSKSLYNNPESSKLLNYEVTEGNHFEKAEIVEKTQKDCPPCHQLHSIPVQLPNIKPIIHGTGGHSTVFYPSALPLIQSTMIKTPEHRHSCGK